MIRDATRITNFLGLGVKGQPFCRIGDRHLLHLLQSYSAIEHSGQDVGMDVMIAMTAIGGLNK